MQELLLGLTYKEGNRICKNASVVSSPCSSPAGWCGEMGEKLKKKRKERRRKKPQHSNCYYVFLLWSDEEVKASCSYLCFNSECCLLRLNSAGFQDLDRIHSSRGLKICSHWGQWQNFIGKADAGLESIQEPCPIFRLLKELWIFQYTRFL